MPLSTEMAEARLVGGSTSFAQIRHLATLVGAGQILGIKKIFRISPFCFQNTPTLTARSRLFHQTKFLCHVICPFTSLPEVRA
jgi:hypothetical protein